MKHALIALITLAASQTFAGSNQLLADLPLKDLPMKDSTCFLKVKNEAIIFQKSALWAQSKNVGIKLVDQQEYSIKFDSVSQLDIGRKIEFRAVASKAIYFNHPRLHAACVLDDRNLCISLYKMKVSEFENASGNNLEIECSKDNPIDL